MLRVHDFLFSLSNDASLGLFSLSAPANSIQRILIVLKKWKGQEVNDDVNHLYADRCPIRAQAGSKDQNRHEKRSGKKCPFCEQPYNKQNSDQRLQRRKMKC